AARIPLISGFHFTRFRIAELAPERERTRVVQDDADTERRDFRPGGNHLLDEQREGPSETAALPTFREQQQPDDRLVAHRITANDISATDHVVAGIDAPD